ncbi:T6SS effector BTH_I2691 family protein [Cupriavidus sp. SW-Y-13]|uniref:T6SS effector BTH_I2691 family protein n=1 Tax=Cupriavidus sp. SW-Y-13 TaxID=2653854 RepID=UPI001366318F|nr:hypothetical protein [Cupriavidus sp. SW-Y-13]
MQRKTTPEDIFQRMEESVLRGQMGGKMDCRFCKHKGYTFLPLRYAVVCNASASQWPDLGSTLGTNVADKAPGQSRYTVRLLREGYLYVLVERKRGPQWQGYAVTPGGMLAQFPIKFPPNVPVPFTCDLATDGVGASLVSIDKIDDVSAIHMLFSPDVVPIAMLDQRARDRLGMQTLSPKEWKGQAHTLQANELTQWVAEFKLNMDGIGEIDTKDPRQTGQNQISRQLYPLMGGPGVDVPDFNLHGKRLTNLIQRLEDTKSPAVVLWDPIGITQELNRSLRAVEEDIETTIRPHEWALQTSFQIEGIKDQVMMQAAVPPSRLRANPYELTGVEAESEYRQWERDPEGWVRLNQKRAWARYDACYDEVARVELVARVRRLIQSRLEVAERRFTDLKAWMASSALLNALEWYAQDDANCGVLFEYQVTLCTYGMGIARGGQVLLRAWTADVDGGRDNLILRQLLFNQQAALDEFRTIAKGLKGKRDIDTATLQTMVSHIASTFDKAAAIAAMGEGGMVPVGMGGVAAKFVLAQQMYATIGQSALQPLNPVVTKFYSLLLYMRGSARAYAQGVSDAVFGIFDAAHASRAHLPLEQADRYRKVLAEAAATDNRRNANYIALRFSTGLACVELLNLGMKLHASQGRDLNQREQRELIAATAATSGAIAISVAQLPKVVRNGTKWIDHLALGSGVLGGFAAGLMAVQAFEDAWGAQDDSRMFAANALYVKGALAATAAVGSTFVGLLFSGPLLQAMGKFISGSNYGAVVENFGKHIAAYAERKIAHRALAGVTIRAAATTAAGFVGWVLVLYQMGEFAIMSSKDNPVQVWLTRCRFRKPIAAYRDFWTEIMHRDQAGKPYVSHDEEEDEFKKALQGMRPTDMHAQEIPSSALPALPRSSYGLR